ncbi:MAG: ABC transporter ATP-binding protein [Candidatus Pacebacteria bacterium]|jgi:ATP-binding cassette subfamily C protein|nr:ABC transporter ATP-binding protein [Candidatus Paceibacterota bacterium]
MKKKYQIFIDLFLQAFKKYKYQMIILVILGFLGGIFEGIGVNAFIPLLSSFFGDAVGGTDFISQTLEKGFSFVGVPFTLIYLLAFISILFLLKAVVLLIFNYIKIRIRAGYEREIRSDLFRGTLKSTWPYLLTQRSGNLETVLITDVRQSAKLFSSIAETIMVFTSLIMYIVVAVNISWQITVITLGIGLLIFISFKPLVYRTRQLSHEGSLMNKTVANTVSESIFGMKVVKSMKAEDSIVKRANEHFDSLKDFQIRTAMLGTFSTIFIQPISVIFIAVIFAGSVYVLPVFNLAVLLATVYLVQRIFSYIQMLQSNYHNVNNLFPYLHETIRYRQRALENQEQDKGELSFEFKDTLKFNDVVFSYKEKIDILKNVNLSVKKGEMVGIIGLSGAGKTTLFDLLLRLFTPNSGYITLDGEDIYSIKMNDWREHVGYISQDIFLTNDTIANNIRFYRDSISEDDIVDAAKKANIYDFIKTLPDGLNTIVGERGIQLSVGQRQRVAIARVLVKKPSILLLDEATSALDNESEMQVQKVIEKLKGDTTILVIAHRLSTIINSDKLLVIEDGKISEKGSPKELLKDKESYFYKMYNIRK